MAREFLSGIDLLGQLATAINANLSSGKLLGRSTAGTGAIEEISIGSGLSLAAGTLSATGGGSGLAVNAYVAGNWISPYIGAIATGSALTANAIYFLPFIVYKNITVNGLGARVGTASAGNSIQLAIYASGSDRKPTGSALASTGNLSTTTATTVSSAVTSFSLTAGEIYWAAINSNGAPAMSTISNSSFNWSHILVGASTLVTLISGTGSINLACWINGQTFGTWPDVTSITKGTLNSAANAAVFLQVNTVP